MEELKKCPFCGGEARVSKFTSRTIFRKPSTGFFVECMTCGVRTPLEFVIEDVEYTWNKRVE